MANGYKQRYAPRHSRASATGTVTEHVLVAELALGRPLPPGVEVHHVDENKRNNANRNLVICQDAAYHKLLHVRTRVVRAGGDPDTQRICSTCQQLKPFVEFNRAKTNVGTGIQKQCRDCSKAYNRTYVRPSKRGAAA